MNDKTYTVNVKSDGTLSILAGKKTLNPVRSDGTYLVEGKNPKLYARILPDGRQSFYLEYYLGYGMNGGTLRIKRKKELLRLYLQPNAKTPIDKIQNDKVETEAIARWNERVKAFAASNGEYVPEQKHSIDFVEYFQTYIDKYTKKDVRVMEMALRRFKSFIIDTPEYSRFVTKTKDAETQTETVVVSIKPEQLTKDMMRDFVEYLQSISSGDGPHTTYQRFKKVINYAIERGDMVKNPCAGVSVIVDETTFKKDVLSQDEITQLLHTHYSGENTIIRRAFVFSLYTGLRFCDVRDLTFADVDYSNKLLRFTQNKTEGHSRNSSVVLPLNDGLLSIIGESPEGGRDSLIFPLPSHTACLKALRRWTQMAGIDKHITWHCARHSFATNILVNGANIKTVASLLGHSSITYTQRYTNAVDSLKIAAMNSLPSIDTNNI